MEKEKNVKKVLHIMNGAVAGGISTVVLNYYKIIDRDIIHFDCAMVDVKLGANGIALKKLGVKFYKIPLKSRHPFKYIHILFKILKNGNYDAIHVHNNESSVLALIVACFAGIRIRIAHAHTIRNVSRKRDKVKLFFSHLFTPIFATKLVACSVDAAISIFGKKSLEYDKVLILKNAIDVEKFRYNDAIRTYVREQLNLNGKYVLGCVGNLLPEKNHSFSIDIFESVFNENNEAVLVIVGSGPLESELKNYAEKKGVRKSVIFLGSRSDVNELLQGMDCFIMPSKFEGFGMAALEAAAAGLPTLLSSCIPSDFNFYSRNKYIDIDRGVEPWVEAILQLDNDYNRVIGAEEVIESGYNLMTMHDDFISIYK